MQQNIINRLFQSLTELESAINRAKTTLKANSSISPNVIDRLESYTDILQQQRDMAGELCVYITEQNWEEVNRHVNMINCMSAMIRDDAREILTSLSVNSDLQASDNCRDGMLLN